MTINVWIAVVIAIVALMAGFWIGRSVKWMAEETEEQVRAQEGEEQKVDERSVNAVRRGDKRIPLGWLVSSPVSGNIRPFYEGNRCGVLIQPKEEMIYAPVSGRISRLFPMGCAMTIATDFGTEILVKIGNGADELCSAYFRSRVVQNEIIGKGKLLLEFDRAGLESQGVDVTVTVSVETTLEEKNIVVTQKDYVKAGEDLMWG